MSYIDLHTHTTASDGTLTPCQLVRQAMEIGLTAIAVTDHDTTEGLAEAKNCPDNDGSLEIISGIEFSTNDPAYKPDLHILGYFIDENNSEFAERLHQIVTLRNERNDKMIHKLNEMGYTITLQDVKNCSTDGIITRAHFGRALVEKGYMHSLRDVFDRLIGNGCPAYVPREKLLPKDAIAMIKAAGGLAVLAHPTLYRLSYDDLKPLVKNLAAEGLDGIEAVYPLYSKVETAQMISLARLNNLLLTGGSDFHGSNKPDIRLGFGLNNIQVKEEILEEMKKRL